MCYSLKNSVSCTATSVGQKQMEAKKTKRMREKKKEREDCDAEEKKVSLQRVGKAPLPGARNAKYRVQSDFLSSSEMKDLPHLRKRRQLGQKPATASRRP